ncbi:hypothetical protein E2320_017744 [Naja naja]|nr:hypothetical protein E2320_017744 [Naja naja]
MDVTQAKQEHLLALKGTAGFRLLANCEAACLTWGSSGERPKLGGKQTGVPQMRHRFSSCGEQRQKERPSSHSLWYLIRGGRSCSQLHSTQNKILLSNIILFVETRLPRKLLK